MAIEDSIANMRTEMVAYFEETRGRVSEIITRIEELGQHLVDTTNPHRVTKFQVGLGSVNNFAVASSQEALDGVSNLLYMTPLRTKEAVDQHGMRVDNPHEVTKAQVGLGNVDNYPIATTQQAIDGVNNATYMTPLRTTEALVAYTDVHNGRKIVSTTATLAADGELSYDLGTLIGASVTDFDVLATEVRVRFLDTTVGNRTEGMYVDAEAVVTTALDGNVVRVMNFESAELTVHVHIVVPKA